MFKENDYIICLDIGDFETNCGRNNFIFKQRENRNSIVPCIDLQGHALNANDALKFDKSDKLIEWRYATIEEIEEYDRIDKPYDVTTLEIKPIIEENYDYLTKLLNKLEIK